MIFEVDSVASSQVLLKHVLRMYKNDGISNGINNVTDYVISKDKKTGIITAENKMCVSPFGGRLVGVSINNFEIIRSLNELPQLMELSYRTGLLSKVHRPGEVLGDWCTRDLDGDLCLTEAKTYNNFSNTDYLEYVSKEDYNTFLNSIENKNQLSSIVYSDGKIMKDAFNLWYRGGLKNTNTELLVYVLNTDIENFELNSKFTIPKTVNKTMSLNVRSIDKMFDLDDNLLLDVKNMSLETFYLREKQNYNEIDRELRSKKKMI